MDVQHGGLDTSMTCKSRDFMDVPIGAREIGEAQMPQRVWSELRKIATLCYSPDYLGPCPFRNRFSTISVGLRKEHRSPHPTPFATLMQVPTEEFAGRHRIRTDSLPAILCHFQANA